MSIGILFVIRTADHVNLQERKRFRTPKKVRFDYNRGMSREPSDILKEALALPPDARASIADSLLNCLDEAVDAGTAEEWEREIQKRIAEVEAGTVKTISWSDAREQLMSRLRGEL